MAHMSGEDRRSQMGGAGPVAQATIASLPELIERVTPRKPEPSSGRLRSYAVFRGAVRGPLSLLTTLDPAVSS